MAINLKKESYNDNTDTDTVRIVYPEKISEEIYPQRERFPQKADSYSEPGIMPAPKQFSASNQEVFPAAAVSNGVTVPKRKKKWLIPLIVTGAVILVSAAAAAASINRSIYESEYDFADLKRKVFSASEVNGIVIEDSDSFIKISSNSGRNITVETSDNTHLRYNYDIAEENNIVTVSSPGKYSKGVVQLYLPDNYKGPITVRAKGETKITCLAGNFFDISSDSGMIYFNGLNGMKGANSQISLNSGTVTFDDCELGSCIIHTYSGSVYMGGSKFTDKCTVYNDDGGMCIESTVFSGGADIYSGGNIDISDISLLRDSYLTAVNGTISAEKANFENLHIKNQNGRVTVSAKKTAEDYTVTAETVNSDVYFAPQIDPENNGKFELDLDLTDSDAKVYFKS